MYGRPLDTIEALGKYAGGRCLTNTTGPGKKKGMPDPATLYRAF
jgi:hypothetical protein